MEKKWRNKEQIKNTNIPASMYPPSGKLSENILKRYKDDKLEIKQNKAALK